VAFVGLVAAIGSRSGDVCSCFWWVVRGIGWGRIARSQWRLEMPRRGANGVGMDPIASKGIAC
jgi:hypothetical protein